MKRSFLFVLTSALVIVQASSHISAQGKSEGDLLRQLAQKQTAFVASLDLATLYRDQGRATEAADMLSRATGILWQEQRAPSGGRPMPTPPPSAPLRVGGDVSEPRKIRDVPPTYPESARPARLSGAVLVEFVIDTTGAVGDVQVLHSWPPFDAAAVAAVRRWKYEPTLLGGIAVPVMTSSGSSGSGRRLGAIVSVRRSHPPVPHLGRSDGISLPNHPCEISVGVQVQNRWRISRAALT